MKIGYQGFTFSIPMMGIIQIEEFVLRAELNDHAHVYFKLLVEEEEAISSVHRLLDGAEIQIEEAEKMLFRGKVLTASAKKEKGLYVVTIEAVSYTYEWSLEEVSQSFMDQEDTYEKVIEKVLSNYEEAQAIDCASQGAKMPGFLLQYEEDDWTFLKRLASHFETFLVPEFTQGYGRVYFGIPEIKNGVQLKENEYQISKNMDAFYRFSYKEHFQPQETVRWQIQSEKRLVLGEEVFLHDVRAIITSVQYYLEKGEILRRYEAGRKKGILCAYQTNPRIGGMSIPAIVKERKGNQIRVHFDIDKSYEARPKNTFFTYAIESSCFYCMPEEESLVDRKSVV